MDYDLIVKNYRGVLDRIRSAAVRAGRKPDGVKLVVVTKTHPLDSIQAVIAAGARSLGENYAVEAVPKIMALSGQSGVEWHMIGHVQSRKAKLVAQYFDYLDSLDNLKLAHLLNRFCGELGKHLPVFLECNVSGEASKSGWAAWQEDRWDDLLPVFSEILSLSNLEIRGLMTMAPFLDDPQQARPYFRRLKRLQEFFMQNFPAASWAELSMGMSADFEIAIEEGATWVRIGEAIMGPRIRSVELA